ncbi:GNAT family N-acetyltransferase [Aquibium sp. ELW1220]|uniref:GNAT family N-acetyltransferase n=1 Tax=Aquibium sp. ELW1220 TaxID=2976766 RepID=UPI0025B1EEA4|nr:GNAT family N-acetyltransferase [Aquibium sp. ELW1220]MDN2579383.1 GNAT family N-acetyltransferase [Aquibium sp. ELW1220]
MPIQSPSLRPATRADAAFFVDLEEACMRAYAVALWGEWRPSATVESFDPAGMRVILMDGQDAGVLVTGPEAGHLRVQKLYVSPDCQNRGLGAWALGVAIAEAEAAGLPVMLTVLTTNPARRFYEREGFRLAGETPERLTMVRP